MVVRGHTWSPLAERFSALIRHRCKVSGCWSSGCASGFVVASEYHCSFIRSVDKWWIHRPGTGWDGRPRRNVPLDETGRASGAQCELQGERVSKVRRGDSPNSAIGENGHFNGYEVRGAGTETDHVD